jgi:hypothetical protein
METCSACGQRIQPKDPAEAIREGLYEAAVASKSDIHEHLPLLRQLASECSHVTELGLRGANGSTIAFLAAQPAEFISYDLNPASVVSQPVADLISCAGKTRFQPRCGDSTKIRIEDTDLLFVDTFHTGKQLFGELNRHFQRVRRYIICHDTATFGDVGEDGSSGLRIAIRKFQKEDGWPLWELTHDLPNCNGLVVLRNIYADQPENWEKVRSQNFKWTKDT